MRKILPLLLVAAVATAGCKKGEKKAPVAAGTTTTTSTSAAPPTATGIEVGFALPEYAATNIDGSKFELAKRRDKVVLLNLWATWCPPCREEIPELQRIHNTYAGRGLEVIGVSLDEGSPEGVKEFVAQQKMTYPQVLDPDGKLGGVLQTSMLPTSVLLDRTGKIVWKRIGAIEKNDSELDAAIQKAL